MFFLLGLFGFQLALTRAKKDDPIIGIDLGTTYSCVAVYKERKVEIVANSLGDRTTPSWVAFTQDKRLVGQAAKNQIEENPKGTIYDTKRLIGRSWKEIKKDLKFYSFDVVNKGDKPHVQVKHKRKKVTFAPEEISAMILGEMKKTAEDYLGVPVKRAVITVPAYFNDQQRSATKAAGEIAGLKVMRIVNEPTAAAMAYGIDKLKGTRNILVFDLGGGTFDVTVLTVDNGVFEVLATNGDTHLGGEDIDKALVNHFMKVFKKRTGVQLTAKNHRAIQKLRHAVNQAKHVLSSEVSTKVQIDALFKGKDLDEKLTRANFESITKKILRRTMVPVKAVLKDSGLSKSQIKEVVLVGGSTRIPFVRKMLQKFFGKKKINVRMNPDEAVAYGAGVQASILNKEMLVVPGTNKKAELVLVDVTPLSLGIKVTGGIMSVLVPRNSAVPIRKSGEYTTEVDNQPNIEIEVFQGESEMSPTRPRTFPTHYSHPWGGWQVKRNYRLGAFTLDNLPPAPAGVPKVLVQFFVDTNGILNVKATNKATGYAKKIRITHSKGRFTEAQMDKMARRAEKFAEHDKKEREKVEKLLELKKYIRDVQKQLKTIGDDIDDEDKQAVQKMAKELMEWANEKGEKADLEEIEEKKSDLEELWTPLISASYSQGGRGGNDDGWGEEANDRDEDDEDDPENWDDDWDIEKDEL